MENAFKNLDDLYIEIQHCMLVDGDVTLNGNDVNSYEAAQCIQAVYRIFNREKPVATYESFSKFCEYYGYDTEDFASAEDFNESA